MKYGSPGFVFYSRTADLLEVMLEKSKNLKKSQLPMNLLISDSCPPFTFPKNVALLCQDRGGDRPRLTYLVSRHNQVQNPQHTPLFIYPHEVCNKKNL